MGELMDNNTNTNENTTVTQNKSGCDFFKKFLLFVLAVIAILKVIEKIKEKSFERFNSKGRVRKYISIFSNKKIDNSEKLDGVCVYSLFSNVKADLSDCNLSKDSFVSIVSFFSNISVRVPEGLKVNIDGLCCKSVVNGNVAETDDEEGGMYVAYNANFSRIRIDN
jgi:predicted membrane protein